MKHWNGIKRNWHVYRLTWLLCDGRSRTNKRRRGGERGGGKERPHIGAQQRIHRRVASFVFTMPWSEQWEELAWLRRRVMMKNGATKIKIPRYVTTIVEQRKFMSTK